MGEFKFNNPDVQRLYEAFMNDEKLSDAEINYLFSNIKYLKDNLESYSTITQEIALLELRLRKS